MAAYSHHNRIPEEILALSHERDQLRRRGKYERADALKQQIEDAGYAIKDNPRGAHLVILPGVEVDGHLYRLARQVPSYLNMSDLYTFSVNILTHSNHHATQRCIESLLRFSDSTSFEIMLVDNASEDGTSPWAETLIQRERHIHYLRATRHMGEAEARNIGLKQSRGRYILILDANVEITGDIFPLLAESLASDNVGITGYQGMTTNDLRHFEPSDALEVDAITTTCLAFRRSLLKQVGLFDEQYRLPYYMDIDFNLAVRDAGLDIVVVPNLPLLQHSSQAEIVLSEAERIEQQRLTKRNFYRFLEKWGSRDDLLPYEDDEDNEDDGNEENE